MVKLDVSVIRHMSKEHFRVLTAVEMGMKNHAVVPVDLICSISKLRTGGVHRMIATLAQFKLIAHDRSTYDGYKLTYSGYDILALHVLQLRGHISGVGNKVGVGKESDIYIAQTPDGEEVILKLHRLGRTSFKTVKHKRDYLGGRSHASWLYMSRLSALKEYAFMKALYEHGFATPTPIDHNRHVVLMSLAPGYPMYQLRSGCIKDPQRAFEVIMGMIVRLAEHGLIHCDLNEFNLLMALNGDYAESITLIDFPQMVSTSHANAQEMFERDVGCIVKWFVMKMKYDVPEELIPDWADVVESKSSAPRLDKAAEASGFEGEDSELLEALEGVREEEEEEEEEEGDGVEDGIESQDSGSEEEEENGSQSDASDDEGQGGLNGRKSKEISQQKLTQRATEHVRRNREARHGKPSRNTMKRRERGKIRHTHVKFG
ncbi:unnamed protein product [Chrysoparadoxa australica]